MERYCDSVFEQVCFKDSQTPKSVALLSSWSLQLEPLSPGMLLAQRILQSVEGRENSIIVHEGYILELELWQMPPSNNAELVLVLISVKMT